MGGLPGLSVLAMMPIMIRLLTLILFAAALHAEDKLRLVRETEALTPEQERAALHVPPGMPHSLSPAAGQDALIIVLQDTHHAFAG